MNNTTTDRDDHTDEDILSPDVSDEALEAAADIDRAIPTASVDIIPPNCC
jgi:hypothetical protein